MYCNPVGIPVSGIAQSSSRAKKGLWRGCKWMRQWSFYCKLKLCNGIRASELWGDWGGTPREIRVSGMFYSSWFRFFCWNTVTQGDHYWSQPVKLLFLLWYCCFWLLVGYSADLCCFCFAALFQKICPVLALSHSLMYPLLVCMHPCHFHRGFFFSFSLP